MKPMLFHTRRAFALTGSMLLILAAMQLSLFDAGGRASAADKSADQKEHGSRAPRKLHALEGRVVDLQRYLTRADRKPGAITEQDDMPDGNPERDAEDGETRLDEHVSIGILEDSDSPLSKIAPGGEVVYLVLCRAGDKENEKTYQTLRSMVGKKVSVTGKRYDRGGIRSICVRTVRSGDTEPDVKGTRERSGN